MRRLADKRTSRQTGRQTDGKADRQAGCRQTYSNYSQPVDQLYTAYLLTYACRDVKAGRQAGREVRQAERQADSNHGLSQPVKQTSIVSTFTEYIFEVIF